MSIQTIEQNAEVRLVELLAEIKPESPYWRAIDFHFADLQEHYRTPVQLKIIINLIYDLIKSHDGFIFVSPDSNIIALCRDIMPALLDKVVFQLRYLLMDDPLAYHPSGEENAKFCRIYDLGAEFEALVKSAKKRMVIGSRSPVEPVAKSIGRKSLRPFTPTQLVHIERDLPGLDLSPVLRHQPICAMLPGSSARRVFEEIYMHMGRLRELLGSETDFVSNRWLFKYLTGLLDVRMLSFLSQHAVKYLSKPVSINLNVDTVLSLPFTEFDKVSKAMPKVSVVVELQVADVFNDMAAFTAAKNQLQRMGYRICLDGLTNFSLPQLDREKLGFDLVKLQWNADLESDLRSTEVQKLAKAVKHYGANRIILCRCDHAQAVKFGQAIGLTLFQGRALDKLVDPTSGVEN